MKSKYSTEKKAYQYFIMGLNSHEIGKLLDISFRTVQGYMSRGKWQEIEKKDKLKALALKLYSFGESYGAIAEKIGIGRTTVYNWLKETREFKTRQKVK